MNKEQDEFGKLRQENEQLRSELDRIEFSRTRKRKFGWWFTKKAGGAFAGHWLRSSFLKLYKEIPEQKVQKETLADVSASLLWRITRIGVITIILALLPTAILLFQTNILMRQNKLLDRQNYRLDQQTNLLEAERRSSLVFVMSSLMNQLDDEVNREGGYVSDALIARVAGLTQSLKPYRFLENDALTEGAWSPEKGQLFLNLILSNLNRNSRAELFKKSNFTSSDLNGVEINLTKIAEVRLSDSRIHNARLFNVDWNGVELDRVGFVQSWIEGSSFRNCSMENMNAQKAALFDLKLDKNALSGSDHSGSILNNVVFTDCTMDKVNFSGAVLSGCTFAGSTDIATLNLENALVDDPEWLKKLVTSKVKGAAQVASAYKMGKSTDLSGQFKSHSQFARFSARNQDKVFYTLLKK
ncbi:MAG: pentapeptide repeat-containing protein [Bacteroidetes bacterium]|nr:pentapeptide repeat-containing protein [Bacteroidota bacterium]